MDKGGVSGCLCLQAGSAGQGAALLPEQFPPDIPDKTQDGTGWKGQDRDKRSEVPKAQEQKTSPPA